MESLQSRLEAVIGINNDSLQLLILQHLWAVIFSVHLLLIIDNHELPTEIIFCIGGVLMSEIFFTIIAFL